MEFQFDGGGSLGRRLGCTGRVGLSVFFLVFLGFGLFFGYFIGRGFLNSVAMRSWPQVPCTILESRAEQGSDRSSGGSEHRFVVRYRYEWRGVAFEGDRYRPGYSGSSDASEAERLVTRYPEGSSARCLVDPARPEESALEPDSLLEGLFVFLPLTFVAVGGGGIFFVWRYGRDGSSEAQMRAISAAATKRTSTLGCLLPFFLLFVVVGLVGAWFLLGKPLAQLAAARSWTALPCVVESSAVREHEGDDSTTYSVDIVYRYEVGGRTYHGNRYDFLGGSSGGRAAKQAVVDAHPVGSAVTCYVDPRDPSSSVLARGWSVKYLLGLLPLAFVAGGAFGISYAIKSRKSAPSTASVGASARRAGADRQAPAAPGPVQLAAKTGPLGRILGTLFVALFWNGITSIFVYQVVQGWRTGAGDVFLTLFMTPFVLIGLALLVAVPHQMLAATNPRPRLELSSGRPRLGELERLDWSFRGSVARLTGFRIVLEGREEADYRRGTSTATDRNVFHREVLFESMQPQAMERGSLSFQVPAQSMHSFAAPNNRVIWALKLEGEIPRWPDIAEEFVLEVLPQEEIA